MPGNSEQDPKKVAPDEVNMPHLENEGIYLAQIEQAVKDGMISVLSAFPGDLSSPEWVYPGQGPKEVRVSQPARIKPGLDAMFKKYGISLEEAWPSFPVATGGAVPIAGQDATLAIAIFKDTTDERGIKNPQVTRIFVYQPIYEQNPEDMDREREQGIEVYPVSDEFMAKARPLILCSK